MPHMRGVFEETWRGLWWVMSRCVSHLTAHIHESSYRYQWVILQIWMSHVALLESSYSAYSWVILQISMSHVNEYVWQGPCQKNSGSVSKKFEYNRYVSHLTGHIHESSYRYQWVMSHVLVVFGKSWHGPWWVMSRIRMNRVAHMNAWVMSYVLGPFEETRWRPGETCLTYECMSHVSYLNKEVVSHIYECMSLVPRMNAGVVSHIYECISHVSRMNAGVMSHIWIKESCLTYMNASVLSHVWMHDSCGFVAHLHELHVWGGYD